jgi:hypothetical protein
MTNVKGPIISFADLPSIEAYLSAHEGSQSGFWLKLAKAGAPEATITKAQAIEAALCHGWIDGQLGKFDEHYYLVRMTPRRSASRWSAINRDTAERLIREARMQPAKRPWPMVAEARRINPRAKPNLRPISWLRWLQMRKQNGRLRRSTVPTGTPSSIA